MMSVYKSITLEGSVNLSSDASLTYTVGSGSCRSLLAVKSVWQYYVPSQEVLVLLEVFRRDGQRIHTDRHSQRCVVAEKALTTLLQPARPVRFTQLLQALRHIESSRHTSVQEEVSQERLCLLGPRTL